MRDRYISSFVAGTIVTVLMFFLLNYNLELGIAVCLGYVVYKFA